jgi:serine protease Do
MTLTGVSGGVQRGAAEIFHRVMPSVVEIRNGHGIGTGIVWRADGLIVTNDHVVQADQVIIQLADGRQAVGQVLARDQRNDLAVIQTPLEGLPVLARRLQAVRVGEVALALGHPFGQRYAAAIGIIAAAESRSSNGRQMIQADVPIGPGSSGGPLLDAHGLVIGINAMVGGGMALAVPSRYAEALVQAVVGLAAA